jgi:hypothetical protein
MCTIAAKGRLIWSASVTNATICAAVKTIVLNRGSTCSTAETFLSCFHVSKSEQISVFCSTTVIAQL